MYIVCSLRLCILLLFFLIILISLSCSVSALLCGVEYISSGSVMFLVPMFRPFVYYRYIAIFSIHSTIIFKFSFHQISNKTNLYTGYSLLVVLKFISQH